MMVNKITVCIEDADLDNITISEIESAIDEILEKRGINRDCFLYA